MNPSHKKKYFFTQQTSFLRKIVNAILKLWIIIFNSNIKLEKNTSLILQKNQNLFRNVRVSDRLMIVDLVYSRVGSLTPWRRFSDQCHQRWILLSCWMRGIARTRRRSNSEGDVLELTLGCISSTLGLAPEHPRYVTSAKTRLHQSFANGEYFLSGCIQSWPKSHAVVLGPAHVHSKKE